MQSTARLAIGAFCMVTFTTPSYAGGSCGAGGSAEPTIYEVIARRTDVEENALIGLKMVSFVKLANDLVMDPLGTVVKKTIVYAGEKTGAFPGPDADKNVFWEAGIGTPILGIVVQLFEPMVESPEADNPDFK